MEINERILYLSRYFGLTQKDFADKIGISRQTVYNVIRSVYHPSFKMTTAVLKTFPSVNPRWLLHGEGEAILKEPMLEEDKFVYRTKDLFDINRRVTDLEDRVTKLEKDQS